MIHCYIRINVVVVYIWDLLFAQNIFIFFAQKPIIIALKWKLLIPYFCFHCCCNCMSFRYLIRLSECSVCVSVFHLCKILKKGIILHLPLFLGWFFFHNSSQHTQEFSFFHAFFSQNHTWFCVFHKKVVYLLDRLLKSDSLPFCVYNSCETTRTIYFSPKIC